MPLKKMADGRDGEVKRMLVIDLVVRRLVEYIAKIRIFKHEYATWLEQNLDPCNNRMKIWNVTQHVGTENCIRLSVLSHNLACQIFIKISLERSKAFIDGDLCHVSRWFYSQMTNSELRKLLQQDSVVAADLHHKWIMRW